MLCLDFFSFCDISWILTEFYNLCTPWLGWMCRSSPAVLVLTAHDGPFYPHLLQPSCFWPLLRKGPVSRRFYQLFLNSLLTLILSVWVPMGNRIKTRLCNTPCIWRWIYLVTSWKAFIDIVSNRDKWTKIYRSEVTTNSDTWKPFVRLNRIFRDVDACSSKKTSACLVYTGWFI